MSKELTEEQCNRLHKEVLNAWLERGIEQGDLSGTLPRITCHTCDGRFSCPYAYDMYNTDGDCLAEK